jgi:hypothetical protein
MRSACGQFRGVLVALSPNCHRTQQSPAVIEKTGPTRLQQPRRRLLRSDLPKLGRSSHVPRGTVKGAMTLVPSPVWFPGRRGTLTGCGAHSPYSAVVLGARERRLLSRLQAHCLLEAHGLLEKAGGASRTAGNAWQLTPCGEEILRAPHRNELTCITSTRKEGRK